MRILCFSDIHGNVPAVRRLVKDVRARKVRYDAVIIAGDLTNFSVTGDQRQSQKSLDTILQILTDEFDNVKYVTGNRDFHGRGKKCRSLLHRTDLLLEPGKKYYLGPMMPITTSPELADLNTIFIHHSNVVTEGRSKRRSVVYDNALLHIAGHTHTGVVAGNYLNTCFLYRDSSNGAEPMVGGYFDVEINSKCLHADFRPLGPVKRNVLKCKGFTGFVYTPYGRAFPVSLALS